MKHEHPKLGILQDGKADVRADVHHNLRTKNNTGCENGQNIKQM